MVSGYSGVEGSWFLMRWCFMERSGNRSVFTGISDCAGLNNALQVIHSDPDTISGRGDG